ncbi:MULTISPECIES: hypothetical protein [Streptomyces]|uniref:hypothetical protein n=1 Tax=Streptomyces TaxID=1883 RepID=UPI003558AD74
MQAEHVPVTTAGDRWSGPPVELGGKAAFIRSVTQDVLDGRADIALHCLKDMPGDLPDPENLVCLYPQRDEAADVLAPGRLQDRRSTARHPRVYRDPRRRPDDARARRRPAGHAAARGRRGHPRRPRPSGGRPRYPGSGRGALPAEGPGRPLPRSTYRPSRVVNP